MNITGRGVTIINHTDGVVRLDFDSNGTSSNLTNLWSGIILPRITNTFALGSNVLRWVGFFQNITVDGIATFNANVTLNNDTILGINDRIYFHNVTQYFNGSCLITSIGATEDAICP